VEIFSLIYEFRGPLKNPKQSNEFKVKKGEFGYTGLLRKILTEFEMANKFNLAPGEIPLGNMME